VANIYCVLGSHGANYIPAITAKNERLRNVLSLIDPSGRANQSTIDVFPFQTVFGIFP